MALRLGFGTGRRRLAGGGGGGGTALPQLGSIVARWSADDIPAQADNSNLTAWTDSVGGVVASQATAATQPKYRTGGAGGKPYVLFSGAQYLDAGTANAVATACQGAASSVFVVCRNAQAASFGFLFTASNSTGYNLFANGSAAGMYGNGLGRCPYAGAGLTTLAYTAGLPETSTARYYVNNSAITSIGKVVAAAGHNVGIGGSPATPSTAAKAEIYDVIVWNRALTAAEVMQVEKWAREKYTAPYPWAGAPFRVFHGDSITNGYGLTAPLDSYPAKVAASNGYAFGQWTNLGHTGANWGTLRAEGLADVDPMVPLLGATPLHLAAWEWYNGRLAANYQTQAAAYLAERKAAAVSKTVFLTSTDATDSAEGGSQAARAAYNAYWDDAGNRSNIDAYVPIHTDTSIGIEGACPNASPYTPNFFTDGIHLTAAGYSILAGLVAPVMAAL